MLEIKWTARITNDEGFQRAKEESWKKGRRKTSKKYLKQAARNTGADSCTAMKRMAYSNSRWEAANQSEYRRIRRRYNVHSYTFRHLCVILGDFQRFVSR